MIGFSQRIRYEWMEQAASMVLGGMERSEIDKALQDILKKQLSVGGTAQRGNREKVISILMRIWVTPQKGQEPFREDALALLSSLPRRQHMPVHWGMTMAVYPFWGSVAETVGRLLRLQSEVGAAQTQRRLKEVFGERETVARAARRILRSFVDWEVLEESGRSGIYRRGETIACRDDQITSWLVEAYLLSNENGTAPLRDVVSSPVFFPFSLKSDSVSRLAAASPRLEVIRHGLDEELVTLRRAG